jgi:hypothetical protein
LIGTTHGLLKLSTLSLTDNTHLMNSSLDYKNIWTHSARCLCQFILQFLKLLTDILLSLDVEIIQLLHLI